MTFSIRRVAATTLAASLLSLGVATASPGAADAGTNGQQIIACDYQVLYAAVKIKGYNQNDDLATTPLTAINQEPGDECHSFTNWWWKGLVEIYWYLPNRGAPAKTTYCSVPENNPESNWVVVTSEGGCFVQE
jgi:hypothetical protein